MWQIKELATGDSRLVVRGKDRKREPPSVARERVWKRLMAKELGVLRCVKECGTD